jgi:hypothetical protein
MGYDVSVIRTVSGRRQRFSVDDFSTLARNYPEWSYDSASETLERRSGDEQGFWMSASAMELTAKEPTERQIELTLEVAHALGARVRGDNLETYRTPTDTFNHPDDERLRRQAAPLGFTQPSKYVRIANYIKIGALVLLALNFIAYLVHGWVTSAA